MPQYRGTDKDQFQHDQIPPIGVLLTNLGTPDEPTPKALRRYLAEFLWDPRVIEVSRPVWWFVLNFIVLPKRPKEVSKLYQEIWTEQGSPLLNITKRQQRAFQEQLAQKIGNPIAVEIGMRYGNPSIASGLEKLRQQGATKLLVIPLYPQYSATTTASTFDALAETLKTWRWLADLRMVMSFHDHPLYIKSLANSVREVWQQKGQPEKLLMSFHGVPKRYVYNGDPYHCHCHKTGRLLAQELGIEQDDYLVSFQSLFGKEEWIKPYTDHTLEKWGKAGVKSVHAICPGFTADCLETLEEIAGQNREIFLEAGGKEFEYIPAVNDRPDFIAALLDISLENLHGWYTPKQQWNQEQVAKDREKIHEYMDVVEAKYRQNVDY